MSFKANEGVDIRRNTKEKEKLLSEKEDRSVTGLKQKQNSSIHSFRIDNYSWNNFLEVFKRIENATPYRVSMSRFLKAMIEIVSKMKDEDLVKALRRSAA